MKGKPQYNNIRIKIHNSGFSAMEQVDKKQDQIEKATVLEVGDEVMSVKVGDIILFKDYNLDTIEVDGEIYNLIPVDDVKYIWNISTTTEK